MSEDILRAEKLLNINGYEVVSKEWFKKACMALEKEEKKQVIIGPIGENHACYRYFICPSCNSIIEEDYLFSKRCWKCGQSLKNKED